MKINAVNRMLLLGFMASVALSSCQITSKYKSPEASNGNLFRGENPTDTTTIANIPWRDYFKDPDLQLLIDEGLKNNFDLQIAFSRIKQAEAGLSMARAAYFPNVAIAGQVQQTRLSDGANGQNVLGYHSEQYSLGIAATWELDIWGKLSSQSRAKYAQFLSSEAYRNLIQTSLISNIAASYYSLLALKEQQKITVETIALLQESANTIEALKEAGMVSGAAVEQSKALLYSTQISLPGLNNQIWQLENSICLLVGRDMGQVVVGSFAEQRPIAVQAHGIPVQMLAMRPDVQQAELAFRSVFELKNAAQASFYPSITLNTGSMVGYSATVLTAFFKPENIIANILGGITQPLFTRKQLKSNLKIANAQKEEALLNFQKSVLGASKEVSDILYGMKSSQSKNESRTLQVKSLSTAVDFTQELLKAGEANYTEVLSAEQNLLQAQLGQVSDKLEQLQYNVSLYRALGGGVK